MSRAQPETQLQKAIVRFLGLKGIMAWVNKNGAVYDPTRQRFRANQTVKGIPDILGVLPNGQALGIEVKMPGRYPSPEQRAFLAEMTRKGAKAFVARSVEDVMRELGLE